MFPSGNLNRNQFMCYPSRVMDNINCAKLDTSVVPVSQGRKALEAILHFLGLLAPCGRPNFLHHLRAGILVALGMLALTYEICSDVSKLTAEPSGKIQLVKVVDNSQYLVKAFTTLAVLCAFWWKSATVVKIMKEVNELNLGPKQLYVKTRSENKVTVMIFVTFLLYFGTMIGIRVSRFIIVEDINGHIPLAVNSWPGMNVMQEQIMLLFARNVTEAARLFCSGYLAVILFGFARGLAVQCKLEFTDKSESKDIARAWQEREKALSLAGRVQEELGDLMALILFTDIVSLTCTMANYLFEGGIIKYLFNVVTMLLYLISMVSIAAGLIRLDDEDDNTLNVIKRLQSSLAQSLSCSKEIEAEQSSYGSSWSPNRPLSSCALRFLALLESSCFGTRKATPALFGFGHVTRGTIISAFGLVLTFFCFMLDQSGRSGEDRTNQPTNLCLVPCNVTNFST